MEKIIIGSSRILKMPNNHFVNVFYGRYTDKKINPYFVISWIDKNMIEYDFKTIMECETEYDKLVQTFLYLK